MEAVIGIGDYLIERILAHDVHHVFGVPGDYVLGFFKKLSDSPLQVVNTCDEQGAGFAADAYARLTGVGGCMCHLWCRRVKVSKYYSGGIRRKSTGPGHQWCAWHSRKVEKPTTSS